MIAISIISLDGNNTTINAHESITIQELKEKYAKSGGAGLDENDFEFMLGTRILDNKTILNELLGDDLNELNITSTRRPALRATCFREINSLDSSSNNRIEMLQRLSAILTTNISEEEGISILASSDSEIVLAAVKKNMLFLEHHVSEELKANYDFMLAVVQQNGLALRYAPIMLGNDKQVVLAAVKQDGLALQYVSRVLRHDKQVVLAAIKQTGLALFYASRILRNDNQVVLAAVKQDGLALQYVSRELRNNDKQVVLAAIKQDGLALQYAPEILKNNQVIVLAAVKKNGLALFYASRILRNDNQVVLAAVKKNVLALMFASAGLKTNKEFMLEAVQQNGLALQYASEELRNDRSIVLAAVQQDVSALQYASPELRKDSKILEKINSIPFEAFTRPLNAGERGQARTSNSSSSTSNRQAYTTSKIISL